MINLSRVSLNEELKARGIDLNENQLELFMERLAAQLRTDLNEHWISHYGKEVQEEEGIKSRTVMEICADYENFGDLIADMDAGAFSEEENENDLYDLNGVELWHTWKEGRSQKTGVKSIPEICRKFDSFEELVFALDSCHDLADLGYETEATQRNYERMAEMSSVELWGEWTKVHKQKLN